ncbi:hypothetical protein M407DRAFT_242549 [Tulasnella calospora MUT 4182]|uniref:Uncharacterized protein n=1 Tax=Tulasnella calospora MUT 4182 TaxID=1051891 RepID=A0A0C3QEE9_9AGAM|nr:hypothetical protein M407DRAFT_242549 [Tulasnella calospora MUT 4182]
MVWEDVRGGGDRLVIKGWIFSRQKKKTDQGNRNTKEVRENEGDSVTGGVICKRGDLRYGTVKRRKNNDR